MKSAQTLISKIESLTPLEMEQLDRYLAELLTGRRMRTGNKLKQDWAGKLDDAMSAIELQKKAMEWRAK
jgi:hypothetical protein